MPSGSYSNSNILKTDNKFAGNGMGWAVQAEYQLYRNSRVTLQAGQSFQRFNAQTFRDELATQTTFKTYEIQTLSNYRSSFGMAGIRLELGKKKWHYGVHLSGGFMQLQTPAYTLESKYSTNTGFIYTESRQDMGPAFGWEIYLRYQIGVHWIIQAQLEHMTAAFSFPATSYLSSSQYTENISYDVYQAGIGIGYRFGN